MLENKIKNSYLYGFIEKDGPDKKALVGKELYPDHLQSSTTIRSIKLWVGSPNGKNEIKTILGIQLKYVNYITGLKKETDYQGAPIEGMDIDVLDLEIKEGDYLSKINIGFDEYINHLKFTTLKEDNVEFGKINEQTEKNSVADINSDKNVILNIRGYYSKNGIRAIGFNYISFKDFCFIRWIDLLRLRHKCKDEEYKKSLEENIDNYNNVEKCFYRTCTFPEIIFAKILSYV